MIVKKRLSLFIICALLASTILPFPRIQKTHAAEEWTTILASDFEDGTQQGWTPKGSESITVSSSVYHTGSYSLYISDRMENWQGPNYVLTDLLAANNTYTISAWVKLAPDTQPADIKLTIKSTINGQDHWEPIGTARQQDAAADWTLISGTYTTGNDNGFYELYAESTAGTSFYFDDAVIALENAEPDPEGGAGVSTDFEDGTLQQWLPRIGHETLLVSDAAAHGGKKSMLVEGRSRTYHGPMLALKDYLHKNTPYELKAYVRLKEEPASDVKLQMTVYKKSSSENWNPLDVITIKKADWQQWHELKGQLQYSDSPSELNLFIETPYMTEDTIDTLSFYVDDVTIAYSEGISIQDDIVGLKDYFADDFPIGAAVYTWQLEGSYGELLKKHFNSITATYEMKPKFISPAENEYVFEVADDYVKFAEDNGMGLRGHALLWHIDAAEWMFTDSNGQPASRELLLQRLQSYIETVMTRYKGKIYAWDVVNEAIADNGGDMDGIRISPWYELIGPDYIEKAFEYARAADPDAKLYYNDYYTEVPEKREHIYQLLKRLKAKGLIDGVGLQSHYSLNSPSIEEIEKTIKLFSSLDLDIQITELDVDSGIAPGTTMPADIAARQAHRYKELFDLYKAYKDVISSVTTWGLQDEKSYNNQAMLFDEKLQAKPAYWGLVDPSKLPTLINRTTSLMASPNLNQLAKVDPLWNQGVSKKLKQSGNEVASFRTLWDASHLYVQVTVNDATRDEADKVELFLDENNGKTTAYESDDRHFSLNRLGAGSSAADISYAVRESSNGYTLGAAIPWSSITRAAGDDIGFDVRIKDASKTELPSAYWNDSTLSQDSDTSKYGIVQLAAMPKTAESIKGTVSIDGLMDSEWETTKPFTVAAINDGAASAQARSLWMDDSLMLLIDVNDPLLKADAPDPWLQDSVEIFIDENHQRTSFYEDDDAQYRINIDNAATFAGNASPARLESAVVRIENGYRVELKIAMASIELKPGSAIGLDIQINDDQGDGNRGNAKWNDPTNETWRNTSQFGIMTFAASDDDTTVTPPNGGTTGTNAGVDEKVLTVSEESLRSNSNGQVNIAIPLTAQQVLLPLNTGQILDGKQLVLSKGAAALTINPSVLQSFIEQVGSEQRSGAKLSLRIEKVSEAPDQQAINEEQGAVARFIGEESWSLKLSIVKANGEEIEAGLFNGAVQLSISYEEGTAVKKQLLGIYTWNDRANKWEYVGGKLQDEGSSVSTVLAHFSKYALLEYDKSFNDVSQNHWVYDELKVLSAKQLVQGRAAALFAPEETITRAEFTALLVRLLGLKEQGASRFSDVADGQWFSSAVNAAYYAGIVKGWDAGQFAPNQSITREEMAVMLANAHAYLHRDEAAGHPASSTAVEYSDKNRISSWAHESVQLVTALGLMQGNSLQRFAPHAQATRAESAQVIYNMLAAI